MKQTTPRPVALHDPPLGHAEEADVEVVQALALGRRRASASCGRRRRARAPQPRPCPAKPLYGGFPRITRIGRSRLTFSAASRSVLQLGEGQAAAAWS